MSVDRSLLVAYEAAQAELLGIHVGADAYAGPVPLDDAMALDDAFACAS